MDRRTTCKGCGATVVKPIVCEDCGIASHPGCLARTGHPHSDGRFLCCSQGSFDLTDHLIGKIRAIIREEFTIFREELASLYRADIEQIAAEMQGLTEKVTEIENKISSASASINHEEIMEEISERERRSSNLIFYNIEESNSPSSSTDDGSNDLATAEEIIRKIRPLNPPRIKIRRLGTFIQGHARPLRVSLPSRSDAIDILRGKNSYSGPVAIKQDLTKKQRDHFVCVKKRFESLKDTGVTDMTLRFINGVPKIVKASTNRRQKNATITL
ncbi:uncharacterized protein LOC143893584 [Temnothorax americanus]|uniref:uncharacterized protein LOC143893584 n=1 Tax=Temnothorax americanus TaxID=1964332 RepID=UPI00406845EE